MATVTMTAAQILTMEYYYYYYINWGYKTLTMPHSAVVMAPNILGYYANKHFDHVRQILTKPTQLSERTTFVEAAGHRCCHNTHVKISI